MEALVNATLPCRSFFTTEHFKRPSKSLTVLCSRIFAQGSYLGHTGRENEKAISLLSEPSQKLEDHSMDTLKESFVTTGKSLEVDHSDIWQLFNEAQRNILYLNKQRLVAMEELGKIQQERQFLLAKIEQLESERQPSRIKGALNLQKMNNIYGTKLDRASISSDLLLRIDEMVLSSAIGLGEASDLRRLVMDNGISVVDAFNDIQQINDKELLTDLRSFLEEKRRKGLHIVHICSEMEPVASVGSLASYVTGLSRALQRKGHLVEVILPKYASLDLDKVHGLRKINADVYSYFGGHWHANRIWTGVIYGIGVIFIEPLAHAALFNRDRIYGYSDDFERFSYFSRASLDYLVKSGKQPDILHIHNWQTAIVGPLFWDIFVKQGLGHSRILFTCHSFSSQCLEQPGKLALCGLDPLRLHRPDRLQDNNNTHLVNILKGGVVYSNKILMVSSTHSKERIIRSMSHGLEPTLSIHRDKLLVAPYGFDDTIWDPSRDNYLHAKYSADDITGKTNCKTALRNHLGLPGDVSTAIVGCLYHEVSDLDLENLKAAILISLRKGALFVFMGSCKTLSIKAALEDFQKELKTEDVRFIHEYDEALAHLVVAGSDIILCPSFHDPKLQLPLIGIKYGTAPVAISFDDDDGFSYSEGRDSGATNVSQYINSAFGNTSLSHALDIMRKDPSGWNRKIKDGMTKDFSWDADCCDIYSAAYMSTKNL